MITKNLAVLVLAAGASKRMGTIKQLLPWKGKTMLGHAIELAQNLDLGGMLVVLGAHAERLKPECAIYGAETIANMQWHKGLGSSIACGIKELMDRSADWEAVLIILCDQPLFDVNYFKGMITAFQNQEKNIVATGYDKKAGVPAIFSRKYFKELLLLEKDHGARNIINANKKDIFVIDSHNRNVDVDTIEEYTRLKKVLD
ncbi:MAG: nucleotidyltransferase family protein [Maribacter sp.]|nr:nucleotidyltransferase family protein [Maribacter sp.]